jgi:hypothetical protein
MTVKFFCIANTKSYGEYGKKNPIVVEKYQFDWDDEEDRETVEEYINEELTPSNFEQACHNYLVDCDIDWEQRGISYILLDEAQFKTLGIEITKQNQK